MAQVLVVEDDPSTRRTLERLMARAGHEAVCAADGIEGGELMASGNFDVVLLDLGLPGKGGLQLLAERAGTRDDGPPVIVVSARDDLQSTVEAVQNGAYDYVIKPVDIEELMRVVARALSEREFREQLQGLQPDRVEEGPGQVLVGRTPAMREVFKSIAQLSRSRSNVLITGESGTGKELVARAIHAASCPDEPFVAVNCAALASNLLESELFGHRRGAFTGAVADRAGRFEVAGKGTLLLDEIGEMQPELQAKLLRVLQERKFERVGESSSRPFEARLLAATHRDLETEVKSGRFREDLLYRLRVVEVALPPLRERAEDIPLLVERLLARAERELERPIRAISSEAVELLQKHSWPGNVRELYNVIQRAVVLARTDVITPDLVALAGLEEPDENEPSTTPYQARTIADVEREHIRQTLRETGWNKKRSTELLGIARPTLDRKIKLYGLKRETDT